MSEVKVNKISPRIACGTVTLGDSGDTFTIPSGATITNAGTASGFGATGETSWDTTVKTTGTFTATAGVGYFLNTTGGVITVNLPVGAAGSSVALADYAATWQTNKVTVAANGSEKIGGVAEDAGLTTKGQSVTFVYVDAVQGWVNVIDSTSNVRGAPPFIAASGGNTTLTCGDYKAHVFTGPGTLCVSAAGSPCGSTIMEYLVVAGGAGGGSGDGGGGGAGGFRYFSALSPAGSPLVAPAGLTVSVQGYPIDVGAGGAGGPYPPSARGADGSTSTFSTIDSGGGGGGGAQPAVAPGNPGGSGGGSGTTGTGGTGNIPIVAPAQGQNGGSYPGSHGIAQGGGGAGGVGAGGCAPNTGGAGGVGSYVVDGLIGPTAPSYGTPGPAGSTRYFSGGGGGYGDGPGGAGGSGGGGRGTGATPALTNVAGTVNTGGGGGGGNGTYTGKAGGSGIVILRYKFQ